MFIIARIIIGFGTSASVLTGPAYLAETLPFKWRAWGLGMSDWYRSKLYSYGILKHPCPPQLAAGRLIGKPLKRPALKRHNVARELLDLSYLLPSLNNITYT